MDQHAAIRLPDDRNTLVLQPAALTMKNTLTPAEAAAVIGCSKRQVQLLVADGTLLARNISRGDAAYWRVVVRRSELDLPRTGKHFLTLTEYIQSKTNQNT